MASTLGSDAPAGMKTVERKSQSEAARATPWAWFPAEAATISSTAPSSASTKILLNGAPDLERTSSLKLLGLCEHGPPGEFGQGTGKYRGSGADDAPESLGSSGDLLQADH